MNLEEHIDDPIKKSVVGMALLGFVPIFSCCGFNYDGEKVKKTHLEKPYIYLDKDMMNSESKAMLLDIAHESNWTIAPAGQYIDFHGWKWNGDHPWKAEGCPHKPEIAVLALNYLERILETRKTLFKKSVKIVDGNFIYKNIKKIKHWQYKPSEAWEVTPEIFDKL
jgi:hypothetical protein